jgi:ketosteroid isomerase-like protein
MQESADVRDTWLRFADRLTAGDMAAFDEIVSPDVKLIIGTAPGEWVEDRERMKFGFQTEGLGLKPDDARGYAEGSLGWVVDRPTFRFPDGSEMQTRVTAVMRQEDGAWKIVHTHFSVGVPDEEVVELQQHWSSS